MYTHDTRKQAFYDYHYVHYIPSQWIERTRVGGLRKLGFYFCFSSRLLNTKIYLDLYSFFPSMLALGGLSAHLARLVGRGVPSPLFFFDGMRDWMWGVATGFPFAFMRKIFFLLGTVLHYLQNYP